MLANQPHQSICARRNYRPLALEFLGFDHVLRFRQAILEWRKSLAAI